VREKKRKREREIARNRHTHKHPQREIERDREREGERERGRERERERNKGERPFVVADEFFFLGTRPVLLLRDVPSKKLHCQPVIVAEVNPIETAHFRL